MSRAERDGLEQTIYITKAINTEKTFSRRGHKKNTKKGNPHKTFPDILNTSETECYDALRKHDDEMISAWNAEIDNLLVFAGLFSAVVAGFNIQLYPSLMPSPPDPSVAILTQISAQLNSLRPNDQTSTITQPISQNQTTTPPVSASLVTVNALWFTSLIFSLVSASIGILLKQWLREYKNGLYLFAWENVRTRNARYESLVRWRVKAIVMSLPLLLQIALILFLIGLTKFSWSLNSTVAVVVTIFVSASLSFILVTTILPAVAATCPYRSPQAHLFFLLWHRMIPRFQALLKIFGRITAFVSQKAQRRLTSFADKLTSFRDWIQWEQAYVKKHLGRLNVMTVEQVFASSTGTYEQMLSTSGPAMERGIAFIASAVSTGSSPIPGQSYSLSFYLHILSGYLDCCFSQDSSIPVDDAFLSSLIALLRIPQFCSASWKIIANHAHRFETPPSSKDLRNVIEFIERSIPSEPTLSRHFSFMTESCGFIKLATLRSDTDFVGAQDELKQFFQNLSTHIRQLFMADLPKSDGQLFQNLRSDLARAGFDDIQGELKELCQVLDPYIRGRFTAQHLSQSFALDVHELEEVFRDVDPYIHHPNLLLHIAGFDGDRHNLNEFFQNLTRLRDLFRAAVDESESNWNLFWSFAYKLFTARIRLFLSFWNLCHSLRPHIRELFTADQLSQNANLDSARPRLKQLFEILSAHISGIFAASHFLSTDAMESLQDCIESVLELAQDHVQVVPVAFVSACEEALDRLDILPDLAFDVNAITIRSAKQDMRQALQDIRSLIHRFGDAGLSSQEDTADFAHEDTADSAHEDIADPLERLERLNTIRSFEQDIADFSPHEDTVDSSPQRRVTSSGTRKLMNKPWNSNSSSQQGTAGPSSQLQMTTLSSRQGATSYSSQQEAVDPLSQQETASPPQEIVIHLFEQEMANSSFQRGTTDTPSQEETVGPLSQGETAIQLSQQDAGGPSLEQETVGPSPELETAASSSQQEDAGPLPQQDTAIHSSQQDTNGASFEQEAVATSSQQMTYRPSSQRGTTGPLSQETVDPTSRHDATVQLSQQEAVDPLSQQETAGPWSPQKIAIQSSQQDTIATELLFEHDIANPSPHRDAAGTSPQQAIAGPLSQPETSSLPSD